jgi:hypothetical protein
MAITPSRSASSSAWPSFPARTLHTAGGELQIEYCKLQIAKRFARGRQLLRLAFLPGANHPNGHGFAPSVTFLWPAVLLGRASVLRGVGEGLQIEYWPLQIANLTASFRGGGWEARLVVRRR